MTKADELILHLLWARQDHDRATRRLTDAIHAKIAEEARKTRYDYNGQIVEYPDIQTWDEKTKALHADKVKCARIKGAALRALLKYGKGLQP